jgi:hypothetical protein
VVVNTALYCVKSEVNYIEEFLNLWRGFAVVIKVVDVHACYNFYAERVTLSFIGVTVLNLIKVVIGFYVWT